MPAQAYELRPRKDKRGVDLISDVLPFGHLWHGENVSRRPTCWIFSRPLTDFPDLPVPRVGRLEDRFFQIPQVKSSDGAKSTCTASVKCRTANDVKEREKERKRAT